jgi:hypothetical protein
LVADKALWTDHDVAGRVDRLESISIRECDNFISALRFQYSSGRVVWLGPSTEPENNMRYKSNIFHEIQVKADETLIGLEVGFYARRGTPTRESSHVGEVYVSTSQTMIILP